MACVLFVIDLALPAGAPASELPIELPAADDRAGLPQYAATIVGGIDRCPGLRFGLSRLGETRGFLKIASRCAKRPHPGVCRAGR